MTDCVLQAFIDEKKNLGENVVIRGWLLSSISATQIEVVAKTGEKISASVERILRGDAYAMHKDIIKETDLVGFIIRIPTSAVAAGITIRFSNGITTAEKSFGRGDFVKEVPIKECLKKVAHPRRWREHLHTIRNLGIEYFKEKIRDEFYEHRQEYDEWIKIHRASDIELERQRLYRFAYRPKISIVVPLYDTPLEFLKDLLDTICAQSYDNWELCLADGSADDNIKNFIRANYETEGRIIYEQLVGNGGIAENTNQAIKVASGEFVMFADHDDTLAEDALFWIVSELNKSNLIDVVYTDEDKVSMQGDEYCDPHFKPDFNLRMLEVNNYICHIFVVRRTLIEEVGVLRSEYDGAQDYDMVLRCCERAREIAHVDRILYHWRAHQQSIAGNQESKSYAYEAGRKALQAHYDRLEVPAKTALTKAPGRYRTYFEIIGNPKVSIIIPNKDRIENLNKCIQSIVDKTIYRNYEIIIVENNSEEDVKEVGYQLLLKKHKNVKLLRYEGPFNYATINNYGAKEASGEYLLFLNNDTEVIGGEWLTELLQEAMPADVGIVGGKLYYQDDTIQHAGVVIGLGGVAGNLFRGMEKNSIGYAYRALTTQDVSAVTAACMLMKKQVFEAINGFDERFAIAYSDVDLCLRSKVAGYRVIFTPYAQAYHYESKTCALEISEAKSHFVKERKLFARRWKELLKNGDPYYNRNLSRVNPAAKLRV